MIRVAPEGKPFIIGAGVILVAVALRPDRRGGASGGGAGGSDAGGGGPT